MVDVDMLWSDESPEFIFYEKCDSNFNTRTQAGAYVWPVPDSTPWMNHVLCMHDMNLPVYVK